MRYIRANAGLRTDYYMIEGSRGLRLTAAPFLGGIPDGTSIPLSEMVLLAPCEPTKIVCVGKNYYDHAMEMKEGVPTEPLLFLKPSTAVIGPEAHIVYPKLSHRLDYEGELGVVIGKRAHEVEPGHAAEYIFGYTCLNDATARDIQKGDPQWTRGKGFDTLCPIGPWIETELDAQNVAITTRLNGEVRQSGNTNLMMHGIDELICYMSACMTLLPGDVVATGTPAGIGSMVKGDVIEIEIEGIGVLRNTIA